MRVPMCVFANASPSSSTAAPLRQLPPEHRCLPSQRHPRHQRVLEVASLLAPATRRSPCAPCLNTSNKYNRFFSTPTSITERTPAAPQSDASRIARRPSHALTILADKNPQWMRVRSARATHTDANRRKRVYTFTSSRNVAYASSPTRRRRRLPSSSSSSRGVERGTLGFSKN